MSGTGELIGQSLVVVGRNRSFFFLYLAASATAGALAGVNVFAAVLSVLVSTYIKCGLLGGVRQDVLDRRAASLADFGASGKRYFLKVLGVDVSIAVLVTMVFFGLYFVLLTAGSFVPGLGISIRGIERSVWFTVFFHAAFVLSSAWTACAVSGLVYLDSGVTDALKGTLPVFTSNRPIMVVFIAVTAAVAAIGGSLPGGGTAVKQFTGALTGLVMSASMTVLYASLFISFREREGVPAGKHTKRHETQEIPAV